MESIVVLMIGPDGIVTDVEVPVSMTVNLLEKQWKELYSVPENTSISLHTRNPYAFLHGERVIGEYALHNGTYLYGMLLSEVKSIPDSYIASNVFDRAVELCDEEIIIGGSDQCAIQMKENNNAEEILRLARKAAGICVECMPNAYSVYHNGCLLKPGTIQRLNDGDFIHTHGLTLVYEADHVYTDSRYTRILGLPYFDASEENSHLVYPKMQRTSRFHNVPPTAPFEVLDPPTLPERQPRNLIATLLPTALMVMLMFFLRRNAYSSDSSFAIFSVLSLMTGMVGSVITYTETNRIHSKKKQERYESYCRYIHEQRIKIHDLRLKEKRVLNEIYLSPEQEIQNIEDFSADLFDRVQSDTDFLDIRLGYGRLPSGQPIKVKKHEVFERTDELFELPLKLVEEFRFTEGLPAVIHVQNANAIGFQGDIDALGKMMNLVTLDIVSRHAPSDLVLYLLLDDVFLSKLQAYRMLPHIKDTHSSRRNLASDQESLDWNLKKLYNELFRRRSNPDECKIAPWIVVFMQTNDIIMNHPLINYIPEAASLKCVFIFWAQFREQLPLGCASIVRLFTNDNSAVLINMNDRENDHFFRYNTISDLQMREMAEKLSPVYVGEISLSEQLTRSCTFLDMLGINEITAEWIYNNWKCADVTKSLSAPLGVVSGGTVLSLDLHEQVHGPHGLVAGTTGSGKSEVLISYVLSMACHYSPNDVSFFFIDFKGGGIAAQFENLPHTVGSITNLDKREMERSLISIHAESTKRQRIFTETKNRDGNAVKNINEYATLYKAGLASIPIPHLIIIVDEFAELKLQQPEFIKELISTSRIGRSLGMHLILATQKPDGDIDEKIWSNSDFKLCLRVQTREGSMNVLKSPLAAEIKEPGRAYLQVTRSEIFQLFQSGYSGASLNRIEEELNKQCLVKLSLSGVGRKILFSRAIKSNADSMAKTQFSYVMGQIIGTYRQFHYQQPAQLTIPPLPARLLYTPWNKPVSHSLLMGLYDYPAMQTTGDAYYDYQNGNLMVVGNSQMGKTNLLRTLLIDAAERLTPDEVSFYIIDFNTGIFKMFNALSVVSDIVLSDQDERLSNLMKLLHEEIAVRKEKFFSASVSGLEAYRSRTEKSMPYIVVMLDNYAVFSDRYEKDYGEELAYLLREGQSVGIMFVVTLLRINQLPPRRASYFKQRVVFSLQERNEYNTILEGCRKELPEIPGRFLYSVGKEFMEAQAYIKFDDESIDSSEFYAFIEQHSKAKKGRPIPEVPSLLTKRILNEMFEASESLSSYAYGMYYSSVTPAHLQMDMQFSLSLVGKNEEGKKHFLYEFLSWLNNGVSGQFIVSILDHFARPLSVYKNTSVVSVYTLDTACALEWIEAAYAECKNRYDVARNEGSAYLDQLPYLIYIINTREAVRVISADDIVLNHFSEMGETYRQMKVLFIIGDLPNMPVKYSSLGLLRYLKDAQQALLFEPPVTGKMYDINGPTVHSFASYTLGKDDCYRIDDVRLERVKLVWQESE